MMCSSGKLRLRSQTKCSTFSEIVGLCIATVYTPVALYLIRVIHWNVHETSANGNMVKIVKHP